MLAWDSVDRRDMATIKPLPNNPRAPLTHKTCEGLPYANVISSMEQTGFHKWGFLILRATSYGDEHDKRFQALLSILRSDAEGTITQKAPGLCKDDVTPALMLPLLRWDVLEDRDRLERASVKDAIKVFDEWRAGTSVERDGEGANHLQVKTASFARFRYFIMVNDDCLASLPALEDYVDALEKKCMGLPQVKVRVVDAGRPEGIANLYGLDPKDPEIVASRVAREREVAEARESGQVQEEEEQDESEGDDEDGCDDETGDCSCGHDPGEGCTDWDVGWMWVAPYLIPGFYDTVQTDQGWEHFYVRPPEIYG